MFPHITFGKNIGYTLLKRLGLRFRQLRPFHVKGDPEKKKAFKEELLPKISALQQKLGVPDVRVFTMDEHRMGLMPIHRRQWCFPGQTTKAIFMGYQWVWVYGFVDPSTGENHHYLATHLNRQVFEMILQTFAQDAGIDEKKPILLVLDQAKAHQRAQLPQGIHIEFLPPYSPELQPAERLWPLMNECIANQLVTGVDDLWNRVEKRCKWMMEKGKNIIQNLTHFHWWPKPKILIN